MRIAAKGTVSRLTVAVVATVTFVAEMAARMQSGA